MSHYRDILDAEEEERIAAEKERKKQKQKRIARINKRDKLHIEESLKLIQEFQRKAYTRDIQFELQSIEKYYKSKLYDLRHIDIDSDSV